MDNSVVGVIILAVVAAVAIAIGLSKTSKEPSPEEDYESHFADTKSLNVDLTQIKMDEAKAREEWRVNREKLFKDVVRRNKAYMELSEAKAKADALTEPKYRIIRNLESLKYDIQEAKYCSGAFSMDVSIVDDDWGYCLSIEEAEKILEEWETETPLGLVNVKWTKILYEYDTYQDAEKALSIFIAMETEDTSEVKYYDNAAKRV